MLEAALDGVGHPALLAAGPIELGQLGVGPIA